MNRQLTGKMVNGQLQAKFTHCYFKCDPFKQKEAEHLNAMISQSRLGEYMSFEGYGSIVFDEEDDKPHRYPLIKTLNENGEKMEWSRKASNCLIYQMKRVGKNTKYDKMFIYHTCSHNGNGVWYGWLAWDQKNRIIKHRFFINHDQQDLLQAINRMLYHIKVTDINERRLATARRNSKNFNTQS